MKAKEAKEFTKGMIISLRYSPDDTELTEKTLQALLDYIEKLEKENAQFNIKAMKNFATPIIVVKSPPAPPAPPEKRIIKDNIELPNKKN